MKKCLVVLSGGQDSTTCLYWAKHQGYEVHAVTFNYGQKHDIEIQSAIKIAEMANVASHEVITLGAILKGTSPLVNAEEALEQYADHNSLPGGLEKTFVPARNQLFLTIAANRAIVLGATVIVTGVCEEDFGGYPDCRRVFINALEDAINLGQGVEDGNCLVIETPLMHLTKKKTVELAATFSGCYEALAFSHTAYDGKFPPIGHDHASLLRKKGFEEAMCPDPLVLRAVRMGLMEMPSDDNYKPSPSLDLCLALVESVM